MSPAEPGNRTGAASPKVRLVPGSAGTLDCCHEHVSQSLERCDPLGGTTLMPSERGIPMDVIVDRCAALDVHKKTVMAAVRTPGPKGRRQEVKEFSTSPGHSNGCGTGWWPRG